MTTTKQKISPTEELIEAATAALISITGNGCPSDMYCIAHDLKVNPESLHTVKLLRKALKRFRKVHV